MEQRIIDRDFGINKQALAVMNYLDREPDFLDYEKGKGYYGADFQTKPWYNGRERGIVVSMYVYNSKQINKCLHIAFFEHRNSDSICCLRWETVQTYWNHPIENPDIFEEAYNKKTKWDTAFNAQYGEAEKVASWICSEFGKFYIKSKEV